MITSKNLNIIFLIVLLIALTIYHFLGIVQNKLDLTKSESQLDDYYNLMTIGRILVSFFIMAVTIKSEFVAKIFFREDYIGGKYIGKSERHKDGKIIHQEDFEIKQSLIETTINGVSKETNGDFISSWKGKLIEIDNKHFKFNISVNSSSNTHDGVLNLRFDKGETYGFYNSVILGRENFRRKFEAKLNIGKD